MSRVIPNVRAHQVVAGSSPGPLRAARRGDAITFAILSGAAFPVILAVMALLVFVGVLIDVIKDDPLQDWLARCPWGELPKQRYLNMKIELDQLAQAFK